MLSALTLDDESGTPIELISDPLRRDVATATGLIGVAPLRDSRRVRPQARGALDETRWQDGKIISIEGQVTGASQELAFANFRQIVTPCVQSLEAPALLKWTEGAAGLQLQRLVRLASEIEPPLEGESSAGAFLRYQAQFFAEDPYAYSQVLTAVEGDTLSAAAGGMVMPFTFPFTFAASGGGAVAFTNAGNVPTAPVFKIHGGCTNPAIIHLETQKRITLLGEIATGDFLEVGTDERGNHYVLLNGSESQLNFLDSPNSEWFELPGNATSNMRLLAGTFDGSAFLEVEARSAYA